ncbi:MAG: hypothetical protein PHZ19_00405 [Candidatus Thermoplasmatota archaeon]|nr:hypothetical protein [Candidatus Thermoplasmatota archaeon]
MTRELSEEAKEWVRGHADELLHDLLHEGAPCPCFQTPVGKLKTCLACDFRAACKKKDLEKDSPICRYIVYHNKDVPTRDELFQMFLRRYPDEPLEP